MLVSPDLQGLVQDAKSKAYIFQVYLGVIPVRQHKGEFHAILLPSITWNF